MFTLAISCLTTSNLPWFMDLTFQVPLQYCSYSIRPCIYHQSHPQLCGFFIWLHLFILSGVICPLISSSIMGTYWPAEFLFQCPIILPFHTVHGVLNAGTLKWFAIPFSSGPYFVRTLVLLGWPYMAWLSFIELDKNVIHVIRLVSFLRWWFQSFCPLMPSPGAYCLTGILGMSIAAVSGGNSFPLPGSFMFAFVLKRNRIFFLGFWKV